MTLRGSVVTNYGRRCRILILTEKAICFNRKAPHRLRYQCTWNEGLKSTFLGWSPVQEVFWVLFVFNASTITASLFPILGYVTWREHLITHEWSCCYLSGNIKLPMESLWSGSSIAEHSCVSVLLWYIWLSLDPTPSITNGQMITKRLSKTHNFDCQRGSVFRNWVMEVISVQPWKGQCDCPSF